MRLVDSKQMQEMDRYTIEKIGVPGIVLMENAARSWVEAATPYLDIQNPILVFCGGGNNGGDGYAIARILANRGFDCTVIATKPPKSADCIKNAEAWLHYGISLSWRAFLESDLRTSDRHVLIDSVLGTGIESELRGEMVGIIDLMDRLKGFKIAVDLPSGISASTGDVMGVAVRNDVTITFQKLKVGHCLYPGKEYAGKTICQDISIQERYQEDDQEIHLFGQQEAKRLFPPRRKDSYKNQYGHILTWCGSPGKTGASFLASYAALKSGAGLTTAVMSKDDLGAFLGRAPELMSCLKEDLSVDFINGFDALVIGCGFGRDQEKWDHAVEVLKKVDLPVVADADAFYGISDWKALKLDRSVLTPHPGEFSKLTGWERPKNNKERLEQGLAFVKEYPTTLVLKGAPTLVFTAEGKVFINDSGNSGLSTAGSGDVLSGLIGGYLAQGLSTENAALLGVWMHGKSADYYVEENSEETLTALDLIEVFSRAVRSVKE